MAYKSTSDIIKTKTGSYTSQRSSIVYLYLQTSNSRNLRSVWSKEKELVKKVSEKLILNWSNILSSAKEIKYFQIFTVKAMCQQVTK